jgi:hypothetical protein
MAGRVLVTLLLVQAFALAGCENRQPRNAREALEFADRAWIAKDVEDAEGRYQRLFQRADAHERGSFAVIAGEMAAAAATAQGETARALDHYRAIDDRWPQAMGGYAGRHRLPNNFAVLLARAGDTDAAIAALERPLAVFEGKSDAKRWPVPARVVMTRNLVTLHLGHAWDERSAALWQRTLAWLAPQTKLPGARATPGMVELLAALAALARSSPEAERAARLTALQDLWPEGARPRAEDANRRLCDMRASDAGAVMLCFEVL